MFKTFATIAAVASNGNGTSAPLRTGALLPGQEWPPPSSALASRLLLQLSCAAALLAFGYWLLRLWGWSQGQPLPA